MIYLHIQDTMCALIASLFIFCFALTCLAGESLSYDKHLGAGRHTLTLTVDGLERTYIVHVPLSYDSKVSIPVVIMLHGGGGNAKISIWQTGWTEKADKAGFMVVFPNAMLRDPSQRSRFLKNPQLWNDGSGRFYTDQKVPDDVRFISAMLDDLSDRFSFDRKRVFVTGFSNGASMSFRIGAELSNRIAAIAPVAGACWLDPVILERPVSMLYITGKTDTLNPIEGGMPTLATNTGYKLHTKPKPPVSESILKWAAALGIQLKPAKISDVDGVHTETYGPGRYGSMLVYISVDGLGHTWAGGRNIMPKKIVGETTDKIKATDVIWDFFEKNEIPINDKELSNDMIQRTK
ncbi:MAG: PHB depolymerase family esterase [Pseudomonadota bacterium]